MDNRVLHCLFKETGLTSHDIATRTKLTLEQIDNSLDILQNRGLVCEIKLNELLVYFITNLGKEYVRTRIESFTSFTGDDLNYEKPNILKKGPRNNRFFRIIKK